MLENSKFGHSYFGSASGDKPIQLRALLILLFIFLNSFLVAHADVSSIQLREGLVDPGSKEMTAISLAAEKIMTTQFGCEVSHHFFLNRSPGIQKYFGIDLNSAENISRFCAKQGGNFWSFIYKSPELHRSAKTYYLVDKKDLEGPGGWTDWQNRTYLYLDLQHPEDLYRALAHEWVVTMDDKFAFEVQDLKRLGYEVRMNSEQNCLMQTFLNSDYIRAVAISLRAFFMEYMIAKQLSDEAWMKEIVDNEILTKSVINDFLKMFGVLQKDQKQILKARSSLKLFCSDQTINLAELSNLETFELHKKIVTDLLQQWGAPAFESFLNFYLRNVAVSPSDANQANFGPRPIVPKGGWKAPPLVLLVNGKAHAESLRNEGSAPNSGADLFSTPVRNKAYEGKMDWPAGDSHRLEKSRRLLNDYNSSTLPSLNSNSSSSSGFGPN